MKNKTKLEDLSIEQLSKKQGKFNGIAASLILAGIVSMLAGGLGMIALTGNSLFVFLGYILSIPFFAGSMKSYMLSNECKLLIEDKINQSERLDIMKLSEKYNENEIAKEYTDISKIISNEKSVKNNIIRGIKSQQHTSKLPETEKE